jgi:PAS domain S-box-containing protein
MTDPEPIAAKASQPQTVNRLQRLIDRVPGLFYQFVQHPDGSVEFAYVSAGCRQICEVEPIAVLQNQTLLFDLIQRKDLARLRALFVESAQASQPVCAEVRIITPSDRRKWIQTAATPESQSNGDIIWDGMATDITDRNWIETALQTSEQNLRTIFNNTNSHIWVHDIEGTILYVNDQMLEHFGLKREQLLNHSILKHFSVPDNPLYATRNDWARVLAGEIVHLEWEGQRFKDKAVIYLDITLSRITWDGKVMILASVQDSTERKQSERQLQQQAEAAQLLASIAQAISQSVRLKEVLEICLAQIRQFLQCDRVLVCRFDADYNVVIELESVSQPELSLLGLTIHDPCFGQDWAEQYRQGYITVRNDTLSENIVPCYAEFLEQMKVRASLVVAILQADQIWGVLIVHQCHAPHIWQTSEIELLKQLGLQIGIASQKASLYNQLESELAERRRAEQALAQQVQRERLLRTISQQIRQSLRLDEILPTTVAEVRRVLQADRAVIFRLNPDRSGVVIQESMLGSYPTTAEMYLSDRHFPQESYDFYLQGQARAVERADADTQAACLVEFMEQIGVKSKIVAPILQTPEDDSPIVWGLLIVHACTYYRQWQPIEVDLLQQLATQVGIAIQQADLYAQLENQLVQKEVLLKEVHHRVKNNLQVVSSMLWLQAKAAKHSTVFDALADTRNRLQAMALIHETLYESTDLGQLKFHDYIQRLVDTILAASSMRSSSISLVYRLQPTLLNLETAIPCGLLLNELVTNAVKHAFPNDRTGEVCITLEQLPIGSESASPVASVEPPPAESPGLLANSPAQSSERPQTTSYVLTVQDNGIGVPKNLDLKKLKSLGLKIAYDLALQLRGNLELDRVNGTQFRLTFSVLEYRRRF